MRVLSIAAVQVQRDPRAHRETREELAEEPQRERTGVRLGVVGAVDQRRTTADVHGGLAERLIHRHDRVAEAADRPALLQYARQAGPQHDPGIFDQVVRVDFDVPGCGDRQTETAVEGTGGEHVVEER